MIYDGQIIERGGYSFRVNFPTDDDHEPPWDDGDGRGIVREVRTVREKKPGERLLYRSPYMQSTWLFDWQGTIAKAKEESWGLSDEDRTILKLNLGRVPTKGEVTAYAVEREFQLLRQYLKEDWWYVGIVITLIPEGKDQKKVPLDYTHAVWGFESNDQSYLEDEAERMIDEYVAELDKEKAEAELAEEQAKNFNNALATAYFDLQSILYGLDLSTGAYQELMDELKLLASAAGATKYQGESS